jgi:uracil-DNA glycosylase
VNFSITINPDDPKVVPKKDQIFRALELCPLHKVKVVVLAQDPYHGPGQANGLAFSVNKGTDLPPSLKNIFKELKDDLGIENTHGDLTKWAEQGVLLLNSVLTTELNKPGAHFGKGWEVYTDTIIRQVSDERDKVIFLLWGKKAQEKKSLINTEKHVILEASHTSPLSANDSFLGCKHFSKVNDILNAHGLEPIDWSVE